MTEPKEIREAREWLEAWPYIYPNDEGAAKIGNQAIERIRSLLSYIDKLNAEPVVYLQEAVSELSEPLGVNCIGTPLVWDSPEPFIEEGKPFAKYRRIPEEVKDETN